VTARSDLLDTFCYGITLALGNSEASDLSLARLYGRLTQLRPLIRSIELLQPEGSGKARPKAISRQTSLRHRQVREWRRLPEAIANGTYGRDGPDCWAKFGRRESELVLNGNRTACNAEFRVKRASQFAQPIRHCDTVRSIL
jgi:hypothetical protein